MKKLFLQFTVGIWLAGILTVFYIVQKPVFLRLSSGLSNFFLTIFIPLLIAALSACIGSYFIRDGEPFERLTIGIALGMIFFGLSGFCLALLGWAKPGILIAVFFFLTVFFSINGRMAVFIKDLIAIAGEILTHVGVGFRWKAIIAWIGIGLVFLMSLAPPIEDFDALFYHLTVPSWWLRDNGLSLVSVPHYWFPQIVEGSYIWLLPFGLDTATHLIHLLWLLITFLLIWNWTSQLWTKEIAWDSILILLTMPSLFWLASWAYTDYALTFGGLATIYSLWKWKYAKSLHWLVIGSCMSGLAISVKYTGFVFLSLG